MKRWIRWGSVVGVGLLILGMGTGGTGTADRENLCLPKYGARFDGSLAPLVTRAFLEGREPLRQIRRPPQTLVVSWPRPVTIREQVIRWKDAKTFGVHYGLERWDAERKRYVLVYEEAHNTQAVSVHTFQPFTTDRVRWTVFEHPLDYDSVYLRGFVLR